MNAARTGGALLYRSPAAVGNKEDRAVPGGGGRNRSVLVEHLEAVQLDDVLVVGARVVVKLPQSQLLETLHRSGWVGVDANGVPGLEDLRPQLESRPIAGSQFERRALDANAGYERGFRVHSPASVAIANGTGARVARKRATC